MERRTPLHVASQQLFPSFVQDLAECIVGDLTPHCGISKEEKHAKEMEAMRSLVDTLGGTPVAEEIFQLWLEYEENQTKEAKFVKDLDKFEMIVQAFEYEKGESSFCSVVPWGQLLTCFSLSVVVIFLTSPRPLAGRLL